MGAQGLLWKKTILMSSDMEAVCKRLSFVLPMLYGYKDRQTLKTYFDLLLSFPSIFIGYTMRLPTFLALVSIAVPATVTAQYNYVFPSSQLPLNAPVLVYITIETPGKLIYSGTVSTTGHDIARRSSNGSHHCDGTNNNQGCLPGPTCTTALADVATQEVFTWDA